MSRKRAISGCWTEVCVCLDRGSELISSLVPGDGPRHVDTLAGEEGGTHVLYPADNFGGSLEEADLLSLKIPYFFLYVQNNYLPYPLYKKENFCLFVKLLFPFHIFCHSLLNRISCSHLLGIEISNHLQGASHSNMYLLSWFLCQ